MKTFFSSSLLLLSFVFALTSNAQRKETRPELFGKVENKVFYPKTELEKIFTKSKGNKYQVSLPGNFNFSGTVVSSVQRYHNLSSLLLRSEVLNGAMFAISKRFNEDGSIIYTGRIINEKYSDGFELKVDAAGNYFLSKINMNELLQDH